MLRMMPALIISWTGVPPSYAEDRVIHHCLELEMLRRFELPVTSLWLALVGEKLSIARADLQNARGSATSHSNDIFAGLRPSRECLPGVPFDFQGNDGLAADQSANRRGRPT